MEKGQRVELIIEDMSAEGRGIGKTGEGYAVFVAGTVPGDRVLVELTKVKKHYAFAKLVEILEESADRVEAICPYQQICGGCAYGTLSYEAQLALKEKQVRDKLTRLAGIENPCIRPIIGGWEEGGACEDASRQVPYFYRNKAVMAVSTGGLITEKGGIVKPVHEPRIGFYKAGTHEVVDCKSCLLQSEPAMAAAEALRQFMVEDHITSYDPRWDKGLMRHLIVRTAAGTGEVMVILVVNGKSIPNVQKLVGMLDDAIYNVPVYEEGPLAGVEWNLESVIINVNDSKRLDGPIMGKECVTVAGKPTITEKVGGLEFEISPLSFYQVNREQMVRLYGKALEYASLKGDETVLDLYCGVGAIGLFAAAEMNRKPAKQGRVIGIESVKSAIIDANRNATINGIVNARYVCGKAEEVLPRLVNGDKNEELHVEHADVAILDPPRAGCHEALLEAVVTAAPGRIVYVSCDPATLARDIKWARARGYEFVEATPCDMFPHTSSVETVALLQKI